MSKLPATTGLLIRIVFLVLMAFLVLISPVLFLVFFVPFVGWYIWRLLDRIGELERRLVEHEKKPEHS